MLQLLKRLPSQYKIQSIVTLFLSLGRTITELLFLAILALFANSLSNPQSIVENSVIIAISNFFQLGIENLSNENLVIFIAVLLICSLVLKSIFALIESYFQAFTVNKIIEFIMYELLSGILASSYEWLVTQKHSEFIEHLNWRPIISGVYINLFKLISDLIFSSVILIILFILYPFEGGISILILGITSILIYGNNKKILKNIGEKLNSLRFRINEVVLNSLNGLKDIFTLKAESYFLQFYKQRAGENIKLSALGTFFTALPTTIIESIGFILLAGGIIVLFLITDLNTDDILTRVTVFAVAAWRILPLMSRILTNFSGIRVNIPIINSIDNTLNELHKHTKEKNNTVSADKKYLDHVSTLSLHNVTHIYPNALKPSLENINLSIHEGEKIGIIGHSGAGKSTLIDIMIGLLNIHSGEIRINGITTSSIAHESWIKQTGYVTQSPFFFEGTIAENIIFKQIHSGDSDVDYKKIEEVCRMASMKFLNELEHGVESQLGDRGVMLSGGQAQRIAIARALYRNPSFLIFDEATNSLDSKTEKQIMKTIYALKSNITVLIIAHRLETIENCDKIIWLDNGKLITFGSPKQVIPQFLASHSEKEIAENLVP